ncbi:MAG: NACHT domain-containing NTPase [Phormidesmis sp.]
MGKRSLKASSAGQVKAKNAFSRTRWTQEQLAFEVGLNTRQSVWKFFTGRPVERCIFIDLCFHLNLEWEEIADLPKVPASGKESAPAPPSAEASGTLSSDADRIKALRQFLKPTIEKQCGLLQSSLDLGHPLALKKLYTPIRIVPHLRHKQWLDLDDLQPSAVAQSRPHLTQTHPESVDALDIIGKTDKILLLGKPGAGKTTFLQYVAQECIEGMYRPDHVPIFVTLRHYLSAHPAHSETADKPLVNLFSYIEGLFNELDIDVAALSSLLEKGKFLLLLDGLDEISSIHMSQVVNEIQRFTQTYPDNSFIITSRMTSDSLYLPGFYSVEVDDFSPTQIQTFAQKWFSANLPSENAAEVKTKKFLDALDAAENQPLKELMGTPILLSLLCSVFLARSSFPQKRANLYQAGLYILLQKWDLARGIQREPSRYQLSMTEKLSLLGAIATITFQRGHYFFEKAELLEIISNYTQALGMSGSGKAAEETSLEAQYLESEALLHTLQLQNGLIVERAKGIYSFSHLTFQEYLTARNLLYQVSPEQLPENIQRLAANTLKPAWHEVIRLTANMIPKADSLLSGMAIAIRSFLQADQSCRNCIAAIAKKAETCSNTYQPAAVRAFYLTLFSDRDLSLVTTLDAATAQGLSPDMNLDLSLARAFESGLELIQNPHTKTMLNLTFALELDGTFELEPDFKVGFSELKQQLPPLDSDLSILKTWCKTNGESWLEAFQSLLISQRQIAQIRLLTLHQRSLLHQYYQLNSFLIKCYQESQTTDEFSEDFLENILRP